MTLVSKVSKNTWNNSAEKRVLVEKVRAFKPTERVVVHGAQGIVDSVDEHTLTVKVSFGAGKPLPYSVSVVEKA